MLEAFSFVRVQCKVVRKPGIHGISQPLPGVAIQGVHPEVRLVFLRRVDGEFLRCLFRVVTAPEPGEGLGEVEGGLGSSVGGGSEAEVEVVVAELQGVGHLDVLHGPGAVVVFEVVGAVAHPDSEVAFGVLADHERVDVAAVRILLRAPLDGGKAADGGVDAGELIGHEPGGVEGADSAGGFAGYGSAVGVLAELEGLFHVGENFLHEEAGVVVTDGVVFDGAHGAAFG